MKPATITLTVALLFAGCGDSGRIQELEAENRAANDRYISAADGLQAAQKTITQLQAKATEDSAACEAKIQKLAAELENTQVELGASRVGAIELSNENDRLSRIATEAAIDVAVREREKTEKAIDRERQWALLTPQEKERVVRLWELSRTGKMSTESGDFSFAVRDKGSPWLREIYAEINSRSPLYAREVADFLGLTGEDRIDFFVERPQEHDNTMRLARKLKATSPELLAADSAFLSEARENRFVRDKAAEILTDAGK